MKTILCALFLVSVAGAQSTPVITLVANAEGEAPLIAPNTWIEIKGTNLAKATYTRQSSDLVNNQMPTTLKNVSVTVNGKSAYVYYVSSIQVDVLTPPDPLPSMAAVIVTSNGTPSAPFSVAAKALSPSLFVYNGGPYVIAQDAIAYNLLGPSSLSAPGYPVTPAQPGEYVALWANGFGATNATVVSGSDVQSGTLPVLPVVTVAGIAAPVQFAGLVYPGEFQFDIRVPANAPSGDDAIVVAYSGAQAAPAGFLTVQASAPLPSSVTYYVSPTGSDSWSGTLAAPNSASTDGPFATLDHARAFVQSIDKQRLKQIAVQFRGGTYFLSASEMFTAADSGSPTLQIVYQNYSGESPVFSGGMRVTNWTATNGVWKATLPATTRYFQNLFYNGARRLRPRLGASSAAPLGTYFRNVGPVYVSAQTQNCSEFFQGSGWECFDRFLYNPSDPISASWRNLAPSAGNPCNQPAGNQALAGDIELVNFEQYSVSKLRVSCIDTANHIVYLTGPTATEADHPTSHGFIPNHRYLVENIEDDLTLSGQWFLDRSTTPWTLNYLPNPGENPNTDTVIVPQITQLLVASGLEYVTFQGLTFAHDNYTMPASGYNGDAGVIAGVSFQNAQHITIDSSIVTQTSGTALEFISCVDQSSKPWCVNTTSAAANANNNVQNSAVYDVAADGIRIGTSGQSSDTNANVAQFITIQNTVVEGYGRLFASSHGITQGQGHDNLYTHNDIYDGYKGAIHICYCANSDTNPPFTNNNIVSFNHVYNLFQGIMNDSGSIYFGVGTPSPPQSGAGNRMLNNRVHDVSDASALDSDGYGGDGLYFDDFTGLADAENNLVYRVSGNAVSFSGPRAGPNQSSTVKNNILAFARSSLLNAYDPYSFTSVPPSPMFFTASNNVMYFDRDGSSNPSFYVQGGCVWAGQIPYASYQLLSSNVYWRTTGSFATDPNAFHYLAQQDAMNNCGGQKLWTFLNFAGWQALGEDARSLVSNPGFKNPVYPADDFSLPNGSPGAGFVPFDPTQAGRSNPAIDPPVVPATFPTKPFNPASDF